MADSETVNKGKMRQSINVEHNRTTYMHLPFYHSHSDYELLYIRSGQVQITSNTETVTLDAPALVLHQPYMLHRASTDGETVYERYIVYFNKELAGRLREWIPEFRKTFFGCMSYISLAPDESKRLDGIFEALERSFAQNRVRRCEMLLMLLLEDLVTAIPDDRIHTILTERHSYISEVLVTIADNCEQELTVEGLAKQFFISRAKLSVDFKNYTGMTVKQYILMTRINHAKYLLNNGGLTLSQVALRCGFCDDSHFINTFRRFMGITPKEYLASKRRSETD